MKVSVIVPIFNVAPYLDVCIQSIRNQTYKDLEIILVDDGSTDNSARICTAHARKDNRIIVLNQNNSGHGPALNAGMKVVTGTYVAFCDGDDFYLPRMLEHLLDAVIETHAEVSTGTAMAFNDGDTMPSLDPYHSLIQVPYLRPADYLNKKEIVSFASKLSIHYWAKLYSYEWLKKNKILFVNKNMRYDDVPWHWMVLSKINRLAIVREQIYAYRIGRLGASFTNINYEQFVTAYKIAEDYLIENYQVLLPEFKKVRTADMEWLKEKKKKRIWPFKKFI